METLHWRGMCYIYNADVYQQVNLTKTCLFYVFRENEILGKMESGLNCILHKLPMTLLIWIEISIYLKVFCVYYEQTVNSS